MTNKKRVLIKMERGVIYSVLSEDPDLQVEILEYDKDLSDEEAQDFYGDRAHYSRHAPDAVYTDEIQKEIDEFASRPPLG